MAYATYSDVQTRLGVTFSSQEQEICTSLLGRAALMIDSYKVSENVSTDAKKEVSINMVARVMNSSTADVPIGATQGSMSGLGYSQSWTISNGATGELYFDKNDKRLLGVGNAIGSYSPIEELVPVSEV